MRQLGKIHCLEQNNDDNAPWIVFFHGFGADANDLFPLADVISTKKTCNWLFPQGMLEVPIGPAWTGRAWWNIDMLAIQQAAARGETRDMSDESPKGLRKAREMAFEMLKQMRVPWNKIVLGGFSQGAMLATDLYLNAPETPAGLVLMSGTLLNQEEWKPLVAARTGHTFFQSHGEADAVLGIKQARKLETFLCQNGMKGHLQSFRGGHEIPPAILQKIGEYLNTQILRPSQAGTEVSNIAYFQALTQECDRISSMKKVFTVSGDLKIFIVMRSILAGALFSLLIFFLYFSFSQTLLVPLIIFLVFFNSWVFYLTMKKIQSLSSLSLSLQDGHLEFRVGSQGEKVAWKDIQRIEMSYTPVGTRNSFVIFTKNKFYPIHIYEDFNLLWFQISERLEKSTHLVSRVQFWGKELQLVIATVLSFWVLVFLGSMVIQPTEFVFTYFAALVAGLFIVLYRPISQLLSETFTQLEVGLGTVCILFFLFHFFATVVLPYLDKGQDAVAACGSESAQVLCYSAPQSMCKKVWTQFEVSCKEELRPWLQTRAPSSLVGPVIEKCQKQKFDKTLHYSRVKADSSLCEHYFSSLQDRTR